MINPRRIMAVDGHRRVKEHGQKILLHIPHLGSILLKAVKHKPDMFWSQLQQPGADHPLRKLTPRRPKGGLPGAHRLHHDLHHLVQPPGVVGILRHEILILDVLPNVFPPDIQFLLTDNISPRSLPFLSFLRLCRVPLNPCGFGGGGRGRNDVCVFAFTESLPEKNTGWTGSPCRFPVEYRACCFHGNRSRRKISGQILCQGF